MIHIGFFVGICGHFSYLSFNYVVIDMFVGIIVVWWEGAKGESKQGKDVVYVLTQQQGKDVVYVPAQQQGR